MDSHRIVLYVGLSTMKGWRSANEDRYPCLFDLAPESGKQVTFFAVLDGHFGIPLVPGNRLTPPIKEPKWQNILASICILIFGASKLSAKGITLRPSRMGLSP